MKVSAKSLKSFFKSNSPKLEKAKQSYDEAREQFQSVKDSHFRLESKLFSRVIGASAASGVAGFAGGVIVGLGAPAMPVLAAGLLGAAGAYIAGVCVLRAGCKIAEGVLDRTTGPKLDSSLKARHQSEENYRDALLDEVGDNGVRNASDKMWFAEHHGLDFRENHLRELEIHTQLYLSQRANGPIAQME